MLTIEGLAQPAQIESDSGNLSRLQEAFLLKPLSIAGSTD
jgi:hypothetical protein